jgi:hypothetical protein
MSRSTKKARSHRSRKVMGIPVKTLPWIIGAVAVVTVLGVVLSGLADGSSVDPNFTPKLTGAPSLEVAAPFFDLGDQHFNVPATVVYNLQNVGDKPLRILRVPQVQVLEGC